MKSYQAQQVIYQLLILLDTKLSLNIFCPYLSVLAEHKLQHCKVISGKCFHCSEAIEDLNDFKLHVHKHNQKNKSAMELPIHCICCHQLLASDFEINLHAK